MVGKATTFPTSLIRTFEVAAMTAFRKYCSLETVSRLTDQKGQTMVEYALILLLVAIIVATAVPGVSTALIAKYTFIAAAFPL